MRTRNETIHAATTARPVCAIPVILPAISSTGDTGARYGSIRSLFPSVYKGTHVTHERISQHRAVAVFAQAADPMHLYADGDFMAMTPVRLEVAPKYLQVIVGFEDEAPATAI